MAVDGVSIEEQTEMGTQWDNTMLREMEVPQGYQDVAVLIIKWCEALDELKSADEVVLNKSTSNQTYIIYARL